MSGQYTHKNKIAIITGGAIRVGKSIALSLAASGYDIALHYNLSDDDAQSTQQEIIALGRECRLFRGDLSSDYSLIKQVEKWGRAEVLINNAAIFERADFLSTDVDIYDRHVDINLKAPFFLSQEFAKIMGAGNIINICDTYINSNADAFCAYILAKKNLAELTKIASLSLAPNIRVNAISVGVTELHQGDREDFSNRRAASLPIPQRVKLDDICKTVLFLLDNNAITGQNIYVDNGQNIALK